MERVRADEEVGLADAVRRLVDGETAPDDQWNAAVQCPEGRCFAPTAREIAVDDDRVGDSRDEELDDLGLEVPALVPEHGHEGGPGQRLARAQDVQLHGLGARLRQVGPLRGNVAHTDHGPSVTGTRLELACLTVLESTTVAADAVLDGTELLGQEAGLAFRAIADREGHASVHFRVGRDTSKENDPGGGSFSRLLRVD